jgi:hypothetical protein
MSYANCGDERHINQMFAQKPHWKLVRAQHFTHEKIVGAIVAKDGMKNVLENGRLEKLHTGRGFVWDRLPAHRTRLVQDYIAGLQG